MIIKLPHISTIVLIFASLIIIGDILMLIFGIPWSDSEKYLKTLEGKTITLSGVIVEDPDTSDSKTTYRLSSLILGDNPSDDSRAVSGTVYVSGNKKRDLKRGDRITLSGKMNKGFGTFAGTFYRPTIREIARGDPDLFLETRDFFADKIREVIPEQESALGLGYLLGVRSSLPDGLDDTLKTVGLTHIIVASGANLSILISFSRKFFGKVSRTFALGASLFLVVFYVGMVGLSPSMVRAGIVSILSLITWYVGRSFTPGRLLIIVASITLLYNPMYLIDLGWLLSFGSFAGVLILGPRLTKFFYGKNQPGLLGATLLETISASLLCTPILLYFFGSLSLISLLANLLVLPTISIAMALCFATGIFGMLGLSPFASLLGQFSTWLLSYHLWVINFFGAQTNFLVTIPTEKWQVFLLYLPVAIFLLKTRRLQTPPHDTIEYPNLSPNGISHEYLEDVGL